MKQIIQHLSSGETILAELPAPALRSGQLLIRTHRSLVSLGTEKMLVDFGKAGWISKAHSQAKNLRWGLQLSPCSILATVKFILKRVFT